MKREWLLMGTMVWLAGCGEEPRKVEAVARGTAVPVETVAAAVVEWPVSYEATGTVRARTSAVLASKVMAYVREVRFQAGDRVREGQTLITLDARDLDANLGRADAGLEEARASVPEADHATAAAKANLDLAEATFRRMEELFGKKSVSNQEFDEAGARLKAAQAAHAMAQDRRAQLDSRIRQAQAGRQSAQIARGYAEVAAPFAGVITAKSVEPGILAAPGAPLATIEREGAWRLEAGVEESRVGAIRAGAAATVAIDALGRTFAARVSEVTPAVDPASRAYAVKIDLPPDPRLRSGLFGRAVFETGRRKALAAPAAAVIERGQLQTVLVNDGGTARTRLITTGARAAGQVEILSGLAAGDSVIFPIPAGLADGTRVEAPR